MGTGIDHPTPLRPTRFEESETADEEVQTPMTEVTQTLESTGPDEARAVRAEARALQRDERNTQESD